MSLVGALLISIDGGGHQVDNTSREGAIRVSLLKRVDCGIPNPLLVRGQGNAIRN